MSNQEERNIIVPIEGKLTHERNARKFWMQKKDAEIESLLPGLLQDAAAEIEFCVRYIAGELISTASLSTYGIVTGGGNDELVMDRALRLLPDYYEWKKLVSTKTPIAYRIVRHVIVEGDGLRRAGEKAGLFNNVAYGGIPVRDSSIGNSAGRFLLHGLNEYAIQRGWGDVMCAEGLPYYGYVYIIGRADRKPPFKVGYSTDPTRRIKDIQVASPVDLKLHYVAHLRAKTRKCERLIHKELERFKTRGEWFDVDADHIITIIRVMYPDAIDTELS